MLGILINIFEPYNEIKFKLSFNGSEEMYSLLRFIPFSCTILKVRDRYVYSKYLVRSRLIVFTDRYRKYWIVVVIREGVGL